MMDTVTSFAVMLKRNAILPMATLDLRVDYLPRRRAGGAPWIGHGECYKLGKAISFVRGIAHDGDPGDPVAHVARHVHADRRRMTRDLPPYAKLLGIAAERDEAGKPLFRLPFHDGVGGRVGFLHGGSIAGLLEIAAIGSLLDSLAEEAPVQVRPINVTVDFKRGGREPRDVRRRHDPAHRQPHRQCRGLCLAGGARQADRHGADEPDAAALLRGYRTLAYWVLRSEPAPIRGTILSATARPNGPALRNYTARNFLKEMAVDDEALFYHSNTEKAAVGIMTVTRTWQPDGDDGKWASVAVKPVRPLAKPVTLVAIKAEPKLATLMMLKQSRLSVSKVEPAEWAVLLGMTSN